MACAHPDQPFTPPIAHSGVIARTFSIVFQAWCSFVSRLRFWIVSQFEMRRFTRLTNAISEKLYKHLHALALYFAFYNFCRIPKTLRVTPAMATGFTDRLVA